MLWVITNYAASPPVTELLEGILKRAPSVKIIITASDPLESPIEWIFDVIDHNDIDEPDPI